MEKERVAAQPSAGKLFNFRPVLFAAVFMTLGVGFAFFHVFGGLSAKWLLCLLPLAAFPVFLSLPMHRWKRAAIALAMLCISFFIGLIGFIVQVNRYEDVTAFSGCYFAGTIVEMREGKGTTALVLDELTVDGKAQKCKLIAYMPASVCENLRLADQVSLYGDIENRTYERESFSMQAKDFGKEIYLTATVSECAKIGRTYRLSLLLNARAKEVIEHGMDETVAAVTKAVLLGDTAGIDAGLYENIRRGGIAHIFAISGLHVGALFGFCLSLLKKTVLRRLPALLKFSFVTFVLITYAGVCAFSPSVVRATVICLSAYLGKLFQAKTDFLQALGLSAVCILLFTPSALFTVGFQLSFAACFGIAFLTKPIGQVFDEVAKLFRKRFPRKLTAIEEEAIKNDDTLPPRISTRIYRAVTSFLATSLGAQIFTAPLLLYYFGYLSGWALLLNCLFVPFIGVVFSFLLLSVCIACIVPTAFSTVILYIPNLIWSTVLLLFETADFTKFAIEGLSVSVGVMIPYLFAILFFTDKWNVKKSFRFVLCGVCILAFGVGMVALNL